MVDVSGHFRHHVAASNPIRPARSARRHGRERRIKDGVRIRNYPHIFFVAPYDFVMEKTVGGRRGNVGVIDYREVTIRPLPQHRMCTETIEVGE